MKDMNYSKKYDTLNEINELPACLLLDVFHHEWAKISDDYPFECLDHSGERLNSQKMVDIYGPFTVKGLIRVEPIESNAGEVKGVTYSAQYKKWGWTPIPGYLYPGPTAASELSEGDYISVSYGYARKIESIVEVYIPSDNTESFLVELNILLDDKQEINLMSHEIVQAIVKAD